MAYLLELRRPCDSCHGRIATVLLFDRWNGLCGRYCRACGKRELRLQTEREARP
jgi:hypothetical protein